MNVTAGVGGPAIAFYAGVSGWEQQRFVAEAQLYFALLNTASVTAKGLPHLPASQVGLLAAVLVAGLAAGHWAAGRVPYVRARQPPWR